MGAKENHVFFYYLKANPKHIEIYIEYRKKFDNIEISHFFIYCPALPERMCLNGQIHAKMCQAVVLSYVNECKQLRMKICV